MHLGIVVVYMVKEENEKLLDLHLNQIRTMTHVPYTIYAGDKHLQPKFRHRLEAEPFLKICPLPETPLHMSAEHSSYLDRLVKIAIDDQVSHIVIFHVDSFPVRPDWAETIAGKLTGNQVLATVSHDHYLIHFTSCLFFHQEFYLQSLPSFLLTDIERSSPDYQCFTRKYAHHGFDSGVGYVYKAFCQGFSWICLERSNTGEDKGHYGSIYGDLIFHLKGAYRFQKITKLERFFKVEVLFRIYFLCRKQLKKLIPQSARNQVKKLAPSIGNPWERSYYDDVRAQLLNDPESYINYLRYGKNK
jgi:hypothetical protein